MDDTTSVAQETGTVKGGARKKRDAAPRGVKRHPSGVWAIRFCCGLGCVHKERVGPVRAMPSGRTMNGADAPTRRPAGARVLNVNATRSEAGPSRSARPGA
jgi:hypothetical protein